MSALEARADEADARTAQAAWRRGRAFVWAVIGLSAALEAVIVIVARGGTTGAAGTVVRVAIEVFLVWRTLNGSAVTRKFLAACYGIGAAVAAAAMVPSASANALGAAGLGGMAVLYACGTWVLGFSRDARAYLESSREGSGNDARMADRRS
jgi:hypothetical protein